ncbi:MAG: DUF86 domain-containing protein [Prevotella sp.]|nr:DUF86 domain-containing protein [Prevotella sp.]
MLDNISKAQDAAQGFSYEQVCNDSIRFAAICYYTMIIGEAAYMLTKEFKDAHPATPWRQIEGMRHHIVHGYYQVRKDMLWNVILNDLQPLKNQIEQYLEET